MREGFFWSAENILPEEGYMSHSTIPGWSDIGFHHKRAWSLTDKSNGETPLWVAQLEVLSHSVTILSGFLVHNLSRENVHNAHAWNAESQLVYHFESQSPRDCYNCIYDDMSLQGWWPWPRPREGWTRRDVDVSTRRWNQRMRVVDFPPCHFLPVNMSAPSLIKSPAAASCCSYQNCVMGLQATATT
jgi:hypothetical protein